MLQHEKVHGVVGMLSCEEGVLESFVILGCHSKMDLVNRIPPL